MKTITNIIYSAFVLFAALILPRVAHAQRVEVFNAKDRLADAQFTSLFARTDFVNVHRWRQ